MIEASFDPKKTNAASVAGAVQYDTGQRLRLHGLPTPEELAQKDDFLSGDVVTVQVQYAYDGDANTEGTIAEYNEAEDCWKAAVPDKYLSKTYPVSFFVYVGYGSDADHQRTKTMYTGAFTPKGRPAPQQGVTPDQLNAWDVLVQEVNIAIAGANQAASNANTKAEAAAKNAAAAEKSAEEAKEAANSVKTGSMKVLTDESDGYTTDSLIELLDSLPGNTIFYGNSAKYYSNAEVNNLPRQYGLITIYSPTRYRNVMTLSGTYTTNTTGEMVMTGDMYIAERAQGATKLEWNKAYTTGDKPTASDVGAVPSVQGAAENHLPAFNDQGNLKDSGIAISSVYTTSNKPNASDVGALQLTSGAYSTTKLTELLAQIPAGSVFFADAVNYYGVAGNNLPIQYGTITIFAHNRYRKYMTLYAGYGADSGTGLVNSGEMYIASTTSDSENVTWYKVYSTKNLTPSNIGAIPTVSGATEGNVPAFDKSGNLAASSVKLAKVLTSANFVLDGTTLRITTP